MRRLLSVSLLAVTLALPSAPAFAQRSRSFDHQTVATVHLGFSSPTGDFGDVFDAGIGFGGSIGYGIGDRVVISANLSHHDFDSDDPRFDASTTPLTFNLDYAIPTDGKIIPWVGGGIGVYNVSTEFENPISGLDEEEDDTNFGMNIGAGLAGPIARRTLLGGGIRYHLVSEGDDIGSDTSFFTFQFGVGFIL